jgi:hypothetical protein
VLPLWRRAAWVLLAWWLGGLVYLLPEAPAPPDPPHIPAYRGEREGQRTFSAVKWSSPQPTVHTVNGSVGRWWAGDESLVAPEGGIRPPRCCVCAPRNRGFPWEQHFCSTPRTRSCSSAATPVAARRGTPRIALDARGPLWRPPDTQPDPPPPDSGTYPWGPNQIVTHGRCYAWALRMPP